MRAPRERIAGYSGAPSRSDLGEGRVDIEKLDKLDDELPGVREDGMSGRNVQRKLGTTRGSPRRSRTAKASRISRCAVKSRCAREWDGWGRLSDDGPGHYNPDPSEGPWGGGLPSLHGGALSSPCLRTQSGNIAGTTRCTKGGCKPAVMQRMSGADLSCVTSGKAPSDKPAFQPYWGKPAVRNDREGRGNVGILRSPFRAPILPDCGGRGAFLVPCTLRTAWQIDRFAEQRGER